MRSPSDVFSRDLLETARLAREVTAPLESLRQQMRWPEVSPLQQITKYMQRGEEFQRSLFLSSEALDRLNALSRITHAHEFVDDRWRSLLEPSVMSRALEMSRLAQSFALPSPLEAFRTPALPLVDKLLRLPTFEWLKQPAYVEAFAQASAVSDLLGQSLRVDRQLREATQAFALTISPSFDTLAGYRTFLDAAGLTLPRWPKVRLLTVAEKRRRFRARLNAKAEPSHVKKAKSLVHQYELTLREILDAVMAEAYGEDWAEARLSRCDCNDLLGKWRKRGGQVLDHADYAHYIRIMSDQEHFETVFEAGFDDREALAVLLGKAGDLRAASHHGRPFMPTDLRDLRLTWRTIETGLLTLTSDYVVES